MKKLFAFIAVCTVLLSPNVQAQTPIEKLSLEQSVRCMRAKAPANWDALVVWIDRSTPQQIKLNSVAHLADTPPQAVQPFPVCDIETQIHAMLGLTSLVPKEQSTWTGLFLRVDNKGNYTIFTDIAMSQMKK